jgi:polyhydroxybutyrate depolymerase
MNGPRPTHDPTPDTGPPSVRAGPRRTILAGVLFMVALPALAVAVEGVSFYTHNRSTGFITVAEQKRGYVLHVPRNHDPSQRMPLVMSLHGAGLWGAAQRDVSRWNELADREGFAVVYPSGIGVASPRVWSPGPGPRLDRDIEFLTRLIDTLVTRHNVDAERVYVNGLSNGGGMTFALTCLAPDRVAAAGIVAGALTHPWGPCADAPPVPVLVVHGTHDPVVPHEGGTRWVASDPFPGIPEWVARWAMRNGCDAVPSDSTPLADVTRRTYSACAEGADVVLYTIHGGGHVWPGGGPVPRWLMGIDTGSLDATPLMWQFFAAHRTLESFRD